MKRLFTMLFALGILLNGAQAQETVSYILPTVNEVAEWPCMYYFLNYNTDIVEAERKNWASPEEDESYWIEGTGPFSNDHNRFYVTEWASQLRPILVRRHFTLTASDIEAIKRGTLTFLCSYDEESKAYLNGTKIWSASGWNDNNYATSIIGVRNKGLLVEGDNVLAVSLKQGGGGGHIDYGLRLKVDPSGIDEVQENDTESTEIYTLAGVRLAPTTLLPKGIYIIKGEKVIVK